MTCASLCAYVLGGLGWVNHYFTLYIIEARVYNRLLLCDTTPRRASVATNGLWRMAARAWHEPPTDTCSVVSASPSHSISIKIIIPDFPLLFMQFPVGHGILIKTFCTMANQTLTPCLTFEDLLTVPDCRRH